MSRFFYIQIVCELHLFSVIVVVSKAIFGTTMSLLAIITERAPGWLLILEKILIGQKSCDTAPLGSGREEPNVL